MHKVFSRIILMCNILSLSFFTWGQGVALQEQLEFPVGTIQDSLLNGFQYFIKENAEPQRQIEVRFCLRIGSIQEEKEEEGIAHFLEHLAFEGSKNYPNATALQFWESLGAKFGVDINASTGYDRTVYTLSIPSDAKGKNIQKTLRIYRDWLTNLDIEDKFITKQKKIVCAEIESTPSFEEFGNAKKGKNPKLHRLPIGTKDEVLRISRDKIIQFYKKWYRPQNASLIIVGDINSEEVEKEIKMLFSDIPKEKFHKQNYREITYWKHPKLFVKKDLSATEAKLNWTYSYRYKRTQSLADLLDEKKSEFATRLVNNRLRKKDLNVYRYWYLQNTGLLELAISEADNFLDKFREGVAVVEGAKQYGITKEELKDDLPNFIKQYNEYDFERKSSVWADDFVEMFLFKEKLLSTEKDKNNLIEGLKKITLSEWNAKIKEVFSFENPAFVTYKYNPKKHPKLNYREILECYNAGVLRPDTTIVLKGNNDDKKIELPHWLTQKKAFESKMIIAEKLYSKIGVYWVKLANGIQLYLKPTENDNRLNISILSQGGLSLLPANKFKQMEDLTAYIDLGGTQYLSSEKYGEVLWQEGISFVNTTENYFHGVMASASVEKDNILCNLVLDKMLYPELVYDDFEEIKQGEIENLTKKEKKPSEARTFDNRLAEICGVVYPLSEKAKTKRDVEQCNLDSLYEFYKKHYLDPEKMICIVTGSFNLDKVKEHLVGNLIKLQKQETSKLKNYQAFQFPYKFTEEKIEGNNAEQLDFNLVYYGNYENNLRNQLILKLMKDALRNRLMLELREKSGLIYSPYINLQFKIYPSSAFFITINGVTKPQNCEAVRNEITQITASLKEREIPQKELDKMKRSFLMKKQSYLSDKNSSNWRSYLQDSYRTGISIDEINTYEEILASITAKDIQKAFESLMIENQEVFLYFGNCE